MPYGSIIFTLISGRGLSNKDLFGRNDAYAKVQLAAGAPQPLPSLSFNYRSSFLIPSSLRLSGLNVRATWRSKTDKGGGKAPNWNEKHSFDVVEGDDRLQVQVFDEDTVSDDLIGSVAIDLRSSPATATYLQLIWCLIHFPSGHIHTSHAFHLTFFLKSRFPIRHA